MDEITKMDLAVTAIGCIIVSISLHYKKENENLKYDWTWGFSKNLTMKGKIMFLIGLIVTAYPCVT
jgi:hypothetical protein